MEVLREHRDSVMAVLEAFVYDPLLNWRLMDSKSVGLQDPNISFSNIFFFHLLQDVRQMSISSVFEREN